MGAFNKPLYPIRPDSPMIAEIVGPWRSASNVLHKRRRNSLMFREPRVDKCLDTHEKSRVDSNRSDAF
jgi:hypothetical protein